MTDRGRQVRRLAALGLVPLSVGGFGGGVAWAASHEPAAVPTAPPVPVASATPDPQVAAALAAIPDARARIVALQATLDLQAAAARAAAPAARAPAAQAPAPAAPAKAPARPAAPAPAAAPAAAPPVHTITKAS
ncbi:MAG: hypothetical protein B7X40_08185 [Cellulomonas sp. 14-74-6]|nr:MAG: hypothetical protein B7X40_08185 [Cellulomonas sp. 14-74-6]